MDQLHILKKLISTKQHKEARQCATKYCIEYKKLMDKQDKYISDLEKLYKQILKSKNTQDMIRLSIKMIDNTIEYLEMKRNKDSLKCFMKHCMKEGIEVNLINDTLLIENLKKKKKDVEMNLKRFQK